MSMKKSVTNHHPLVLLIIALWAGLSIVEVMQSTLHPLWLVPAMVLTVYAVYLFALEMQPRSS